ncbi:MAG: YdjY domain-containing protein, partial [Planctomycetota bacterium]
MSIVALAIGATVLLSDPASPAATQPSERLTPFPNVTVDFKAMAIEVSASVIHAPEPLEQVVCVLGSRDHETLLTAKVRPSQLHAAMLMLDLNPGMPGRFVTENEVVRFEPPTGDALELVIHVTADDGSVSEHTIESWIIDDKKTAYEDPEWVFAGSLVMKNQKWMGDGEHYVADMTGTLVGFVTFGDEPIALTKAISEFAEERPREWRPNLDIMPAE